MTEPVPDLLSVGTQAIQERAKDLGLTWGLRMATVDNVYSGAVLATYDGDTQSIDMISMIGTLAPGERVYALSVPPSGNFITGRANACESGDQVVTFVAQTSFTIDIDFMNPFLNNPRVFCNINSGAGSTTTWTVRAFNISTSGFTMYGVGSSASWTGVNVNWMAFAR